MIYRSVSTLLLSVLLVATCGYYPLIKIRQRNIRESVWSGISRSISKERLHCIRITPGNWHEISWERKDKEFRYREMMYDVVRTEHHTDTTYYYCIADREEGNLFAGFREWMQQQSEPGDFGKQVLQKMITLLLSLYFPAQRLPFLETFVLHRSTCTPVNFACLCGFDREVLHPPDRIIS